MLIAFENTYNRRDRCDTQRDVAQARPGLYLFRYETEFSHLFESILLWLLFASNLHEVKSTELYFDAHFVASCVLKQLLRRKQMFLMESNLRNDQFNHSMLFVHHLFEQIY